MNLVFLEGIFNIANVLLSIAAGVIAASLFSKAWKIESLKAWRPLIFALIFFAVQQILGALRSFNIFSTPYLTHIVPSIILGLIIASIVMQIDVTKRGVR